MDKVWKPSESYLELTEASETRWMIFWRSEAQFLPGPRSFTSASFIPPLYLLVTRHDIIDTSN